MTLKKRTLYVILIIALVLAVDMLFLHLVFPVKRARLLKEINQEVESSLEKHPPSKKEAEALSAQSGAEMDFKSASQACLGSTWGTYQTFPQELQQLFHLQSKVVDIENIHLNLPSGEERRIHVVSDGRSHRTVRLFGLNKEGLPDPIPLDPELRSKPVDEMIQTLKDQGKIFFHQTKERWLLGNGTTLLVTFENSQATEFQLFGPDKTLSCFKDSCQCL